jgi:geranylgeranyl diphosphate synthase type I
VADNTADSEPLDRDHPVFTLAAALEVFHAAALVHDDIMDKSDTRRGDPSAHRHFESYHLSQRFAKDAGHYGLSTALMVGDLLLAWSSELVTDALAQLPDPAVISGVRREFHKMWNEVTLGQYLDIHEESCWPLVSDVEKFERSMLVVTYKSAKYSMEAPLLLGASLARAQEGQLKALGDFGLPLGIAFQLRDDLLGVFGDPDVTGKPSGDDLREGKRTVLIALATAGLSGGVRNLFDEMLGNPDVTDEQIAVMQNTLVESGAPQRVEEIIDSSVQRALSALENAEIDSSARDELSKLASAVVARSA